MAKRDLGATADRLYLDFMAPLVLGGDLKPGRPIGGGAALALGVERTVTDPDRVAHVQLARIRRARQLAPVDGVGDATVEEWALAACLHDLVQTTHPALVGLFRGGVPNKLLAILEQTVECIPAPRTVGEALSRHTWFARVFEIMRTDTTIKWWAGSQHFLGRIPPERMMSWPRLRRVHVETTPRPLVELPEHGAAVDRERFARALLAVLAKTPLTDLATLDRAEPAFVWTSATLSFVGSRHGRTLALRALRRVPEPAAMASLGRATRLLLAAAAPPFAREPALALLAELALATAQEAQTRGAGRATSTAGAGAPLTKPSTAVRPPEDDAAFARALGALVGLAELEARRAQFAHEEREALSAELTRHARSPHGAAARALLSPPPPALTR